jgi:hypothetical protein
MTKRLSILSALLVLAALAMVPAAQAKPFSGVADQRVETLQDARFQKSGIKRYRVAVSYDQIRQGTRRGASLYAKSLLARQDDFFRLAKQQRLDVMVSFYRTSLLSPKKAAASLPSVAQFQKDFRAFRKRYPQIKKFSNWNEINFKIAQPTGRNPKRAGQFYKMLRKECRGGKCSVLTGDFRPDGSKHDAAWLKAFLKEIGKGPHQWGLIPYLDTNKFSTKLTKKFLKDTKKGNVYVTENGPIDVFPFGGFRTNPTRQNKAMRYSLVTYPKVSKRIKGQYVYSWQRPADAPKNAFDSALIDGKGKPRPAYFTFFKYLGKKAPQ